MKLTIKEVFVIINTSLIVFVLGVVAALNFVM